MGEWFAAFWCVERGREACSIVFVLTHTFRQHRRTPKLIYLISDSFGAFRKRAA